MYSVLNAVLEYTNFYKLESITLYTFLLVFKIVENLQCILELIIGELTDAMFYFSS